MCIYLYNTPTLTHPTSHPHFYYRLFGKKSQILNLRRTKNHLESTKYIRIFGLAFRILFHILIKNKSYEKIITTIYCVINGIMYRALPHKTPSKNHEKHF